MQLKGYLRNKFEEALIRQLSAKFSPSGIEFLVKEPYLMAELPPVLHFHPSAKVSAILEEDGNLNLFAEVYTNAKDLNKKMAARQIYSLNTITPYEAPGLIAHMFSEMQEQLISYCLEEYFKGKPRGIKRS